MFKFILFHSVEDFLDTDSYKVDPPKGNICYDSKSNSIYPNSENAEGVIDIKSNSDNRLLAEFIVYFGSKETREENLKNAIAKMSKKGGEAVFFSMENNDKAEISADVLNALIASTNVTKDSERNHLVITLKSSSGNKVDWDFNSANMKNTVKKNIVLNVQVGDKVENMGINKILEKTKEIGLKVGFWDNGELPGETQVHLYLSDEEAAILEGNAYGKTKISDEDINNIYLYYYNPSTQRLVKERSNLYINSKPNNKKYISIPVTHNSDFVLSTASDLDKDTSSNSGIISGGGISIVYTPAPVATSTAAPMATSTVSPEPTATSTAVPNALPIPTSTVAPTAAPTITPAPVATPTIVPTLEPTITPEPTVVPSVKNKVKKVKAVYNVPYKVDKTRRRDFLILNTAG